MDWYNFLIPDQQVQASATTQKEAIQTKKAKKLTDPLIIESAVKLWPSSYLNAHMS